jgi:hypothetical protein
MLLTSMRTLRRGEAGSRSSSDSDGNNISFSVRRRRTTYAAAVTDATYTAAGDARCVRIRIRYTRARGALLQKVFEYNYRYTGYFGLAVILRY